MLKTAEVSQATLYDIAKLAAKAYADADRWLMSDTEQQLVDKLEQAGFLKKGNLPDSFTGDAAEDEAG